jgi:hypothetical protein
VGGVAAPDWFDRTSPEARPGCAPAPCTEAFLVGARLNPNVVSVVLIPFQSIW